MKSTSRIRIRPIVLNRTESSEDSSSGSARECEDAVLARRVGIAAAGIWFCGILLAAYTLYIGRNLFVPITLAVFAYLTVRPIIRACSRIGIPPWLSASAVMLLLGGALATAIYLFSAPAKQMLAEVPRSMTDAKAKLSFVFDSLQTVNEATEDISETAEKEEISADEKPVPVEIKQPAWTTTSPLVSGTGNFMSFLSIAAVMLFFLMAAGDALIRDMMSALPTFSSKRRFIETIADVQEALSGYLACVTMINIGLGVCVGIAMWLLGMPSPVLWGIAAMLFNYIPIVGAVVGIVSAFFVGLVNFDHAASAFVVAGVYLTLTTLEAQIITPSVLGKSMKLSSVLVFLSIVVWGWMWGMMGIFLAVPILIATMMIGKQFETRAVFSSVFGE